MQNKRAVIVGGSVGGLFAGNYLCRRNWDVEILETAPESLASRGQGIARHAELEDLLDLLDVPRGMSGGIDVSGRTAFDRTGAIISQFELDQQLCAWNQVYLSLLDLFPRAQYHGGNIFAGMETTGGVTTVRTTEGRTFEADVVIGADGFRSGVRQIVAPEIQPEYAGYVAWRGTTPESDLSETFRVDIFSHYAFLFMSGSQLIGYPIDGPDGSQLPGERRYTYLWYHPASEEKLADILTDASGKTHEYGIAPHLMRPEHLKTVRENARREMPANFHEAVMRAESTTVQPIYDVDNDHLAFGNVALIGDAAFVARPHVGVGVLKAGQDALALANALADCDSIPEAMARYEAERLPAGKRALNHARNLGAFIQRGLDSPTDDPSLNLPLERIIRVSGRPVEHVIEQGL
ncbi:MAG: FAD-dependent oxidoreductase [Rhodospirillaceae bacterium]|jgi:2-polyprenyl-6-methoxyphenol hydroxylase-like FAD-dependent oxidoreductase|nr:FAD-dependent oxidoreductase [Rhodospirillaceae bacterium]MBT6405124.1 FAD-dependent oxidoreductase [Rhodospirillaceae bacterium]MBT6535922.1 FAD-dependent oxidoreductase [Rhodospirillaceae bacterium]MBT7362873.1 FAD-dependent oxidoreductase [Rhodospirillaceae bacterium]